MGRRPTAGRALAGAALAALAAGLAIWGAASPALLVFAAALLGGLLGWLPDRRVYRPLRRLRDRMDRGEPAALAASGSEQVDMLAAAIDRVTGELGRSLEEADVERRYLREILESMSDGVLVADRDRKGELSNPAFRALFSDCLARPHDSVLDLSGSPVLVDFLDRIAAAAKVVRQRVEGVAGHTLELRGRSLAGGRSVVVARDLSEQLRLDETRRALVANVSHELRTPLTAIRGYAENLREGAVDEPATAGRFLDRILAQCSRLEALLGDLLALSRLERDKPLPFDPAVDLGAIAERSLETVRALAAERRVELRFTPSPAPLIAGHEESLERLLLNLLDNAIKYNREGGQVTVALRSVGGELLLEVADSGIGVPQGDVPRIFERFYRVDSGRSRAEGGTGLGLAIVKHAARLHGGRVEVFSELGRGSVFRVFLPIGR